MLKVEKFIRNRKIFASNFRPLDPIISVIMPTYCRGDSFLKKAIESVLNQTFISFEFIIIDDGSKDSTFQTLKEYQVKDNRIVIIRHDFNSGLPALRINEGILEARGKYISYQFDDDEYLPNCLENLYHEIIKYNNPCLVYGNCQLEIKNRNGTVDKLLLGKSFNYTSLINGNYIANNSVLHDKIIFNDIGMYDPHVISRRLSDWDLWIRMAEKFSFYWVDKNVTKVFAGEKDSLGTTVEFNFNYLRKHIGSCKKNILSLKNIRQYEVDDLEKNFKYFSKSEIDYLNKEQIIPYLNNLVVKNSFFL